MIVEGTRNFGGGFETVDVVIDPFNVLCEMVCEWRESIGVQRRSEIMGGYWMKYVGDEEPDITFSRLRLATRDEIVRFDAFKNIIGYSATL